MTVLPIPPWPTSTTVVPPGTCLIHGPHGRMSCPTCTTSATLAPPVVAPFKPGNGDA